MPEGGHCYLFRALFDLAEPEMLDVGVNAGRYSTN
jgi:hypothetical protein